MLREDGGPVLREDGVSVLREDGTPVLRAVFHGAQWIQDERGVSEGTLGSGSGAGSVSIASCKIKRGKFDFIGLRQRFSTHGQPMTLVLRASFFVILYHKQ